MDGPSITAMMSASVLSDPLDGKLGNQRWPAPLPAGRNQVAFPGGGSARTTSSGLGGRRSGTSITVTTNARALSDPRR